MTNETTLIIKNRSLTGEDQSLEGNIPYDPDPRIGHPKGNRITWSGRIGPKSGSHIFFWLPLFLL